MKQSELKRGYFIFRQVRHGLDGKEFVLYKIRALKNNCNEETGFGYKFNGGKLEYRIGGRWLRKWGFDELPQIINILKGEMALVGPRPLTGCARRQLPPEHVAKRESVKPGWLGTEYAYPSSTPADLLRNSERFIDDQKMRPVLARIEYFFRTIYNYYFARRVRNR